jgi:tryptophan synthase beta chain
VTDDDAMQAGLDLSQLEGIIPAIETSHALAVLNDKKFKPEGIVVISLSGRGDKDLSTIDYFNL